MEKSLWNLNQAAVLRAIIDNLPSAVFAKDAKDGYRWILWNRAAEELFGLKAETTLGKTDHDLFPKAEADFFHATDLRVMQGGKVVEVMEEPVTTLARGTWYAHTIKIPILDEAGTPSVLLAIAEDITIVREATENLRAKLAAERANQAKSEFLANMSHELRTPLNSIIGLTRLMLSGDLNEDQRSMLTTVKRASDTLLYTVNDILDLTKIEAKQIKLEQIDFPLSEIVSRVISIMKPLAKEKGITLVCASDVNLLPLLNGDPLRLERILINLVGNAIKYTLVGSVTVRISCVEYKYGGYQLHGDVVDTGIGIAPEHHTTIFKEFSQADSSTTRKFGGTGLGLAITRELVELMQGDMGVESALGQGSRFWFHMPFAHGVKAAEFAPLVRNISNKNGLDPSTLRLLVAEDNRLNQIFMQKILEKLGFTNIVFAQDGKLAVDAYQQSAYDLILMDCHMPELDGYGATRAIRELERVSGIHVPIVAITANVMPGERENCLSCGMDEYIGKPVDFDLFRELIGRWVMLAPN